MTLVYQIDNGCKRLLWIGKDRTAATFNGFFGWLGKDRCKQLEFVTSDMWRAFITTIARRANTAVHVLDRFHVMRLFGEAIDDVRRDEARKLRAQGDHATLKHTRWVLLKRKENLTGKQFRRVTELMRVNNSTVRGYLLKESFQDFWSYTSPAWAAKSLDHWVNEAIKTRLEPFRKLTIGHLPTPRSAPAEDADRTQGERQSGLCPPPRSSHLLTRVEPRQPCVSRRLAPAEA